MSDLWPETIPIMGYEGLYAVNEMGQVLSYPKPTNNRYLTPRWMTPSIASRSKTGKKGGTGYSTVQLFKDGKMKVIAVHRLVAQAFIPNPNNLPQVNHKDGNKQNNNKSNLEWCTVKYNANYKRPEVPAKPPKKPMTDLDDKLKSILSAHRSFVFNSCAGGEYTHNAIDTIAQIHKAYKDEGWYPVIGMKLDGKDVEPMTGQEWLERFEAEYSRHTLPDGSVFVFDNRAVEAARKAAGLA